MPPRWPRQPDRSDPDYRRLDDRMNFAVHGMIYLCINSGLWFVHQLRQCDWPWLLPFSGAWFGLVLIHFLYIAMLADYSVKSND